MRRCGARFKDVRPSALALVAVAFMAVAAVGSWRAYDGIWTSIGQQRLADRVLTARSVRTAQREDYADMRVITLLGQHASIAAISTTSTCRLPRRRIAVGAACSVGSRPRSTSCPADPQVAERHAHGRAVMGTQTGARRPTPRILREASRPRRGQFRDSPVTGARQRTHARRCSSSMR